MGLIRIAGAAPAPSLGGAGAVMEVRHIASIGGSAIIIGNNTSWAENSFARYGGDVAPIASTNGWVNGSGGSTPNRGYINYLNALWKRARNTGAGTVPIDWACGLCAGPLLNRPTADMQETLSVWEYGVTMALDSLPVGAITRDMGAVMIYGLTTGFPNVMRAGVAAGNQYAGFGVVYSGNGTGDLSWIVKQDGVFGGGPLNEIVPLGDFGTDPVRVVMRVHSATLASEAKVDVFVNGRKVITRFWGPGTILPLPATTTFSTLPCYFRYMIRAGQDVANISALLFRDEYMRAAATEALLG